MVNRDCVCGGFGHVFHRIGRVDNINQWITAPRVRLQLTRQGHFQLDRSVSDFCSERLNQLYSQVFWNLSDEIQQSEQLEAHIQLTGKFVVIGRIHFDAYCGRGPNNAVPIRTCVDPSAIACSRSSVMPIDSVLRTCPQRFASSSSSLT